MCFHFLLRVRCIFCSSYDFIGRENFEIRTRVVAAALLLRDRHLEFLKGIVTDLLVDFLKLKGHWPRPIPELVAVLSKEEKYSFAALVDVFKAFM
jgi:hypothetical protein